MACIHSHKNRISVLIDNFGNSVSIHQDIENCFTSFFQDLWRSKCRWSFEDLNKALPPNYKTIFEEDSFFLTKSMSYREILTNLKEMAKDKSPWPDGLNFEFYLFYSDIIKDPLFRAISHFFYNTKLPSSWGKCTLCLFLNQTTLTLFWISGPYLYAMCLTKSFLKF